MHARQFFSHPEFLTHPERACHGMQVALPNGIADVADVVTRLERIAVDVPGLAPLTVWCDSVAGKRADRVAEERRARELGRLIQPGGSPVRAVVLEYQDGLADLVLTAHRAVVDSESLRHIGSAALSGQGPGAVVVDSASVTGAGEILTSTAKPVQFRLPTRKHHVGGDGIARHTVPVTLQSASQIVAGIATVHAVYNGPGPAAITVVHPRESGATDDQVTVSVIDVNEKTTVDDAVLAAEPAGAVVDTGRPFAGLIIGRSESGARYSLGAGLPFPLTVFWEQGTDEACHSEVLAEAGIPDQISRDFARLLASAVSQIATSAGTTALADLELMTSADQAEVLAVGLGPQLNPLPADSIPSAFARVAEAQPDAWACSDDVQRLTYAELDARTDSMAAALRKHGANAGVRVGVCMDRGVDLIVTLLGVLRTGAAYVPMDVRAPEARLAFTATDASVVLVVTDMGSFPALEGTEIVTARALLSEGEMQEVPEELGPDADDVAYVIYTSGTTGRPKGVVVPHRNVMALVAATRDDLDLGPDDVWTQFHTSSFDFSVWEIWGCLLTGGHLVCVPYWTSRTPSDFHALLARERVTVLNQTPSAFAQLIHIDEKSPEKLPLRLVIFGGEPLDTTMLNGWFNRYPGGRCRIVNMFGITETTVHVTTETVTAADAAMGSRSVGRALPGWTVSVRDTNGKLLPFGAPGEIFVGGAGVAVGYLNRPELTAERFVDDPDQGRVYRSGDLGRLWPDGRLDHLGRLDSQVQIRGHRIELGEIRAVLTEHPKVRSAAVVVGGGEQDWASKRLDAYVVLDAAASTAEIRNWAAKTLPEYMLPSTVTVLPELPLTVNGKVELARLPAPRSLADTARGAFADSEPISAGYGTEPLRIVETMTRVWRSVFAAVVTPDDDFFELGGNSLLAIRLIVEHQAAGLPDISIADLYSWPTISELARQLDG